MRRLLSRASARSRGRVPIPSNWPLMRRCGSPEARWSNIWNLTLDEPALTTRIASMAITPWGGALCCVAPRRKEPLRRRRPCGCAPNPPVRSESPAPGAKHQTSRIRLRQEDQVFCQHVAGFEVRHDQDLCFAGDRRLNALNSCRFRTYRIIERQRAVDNRIGNLFAVGHFAQRRRIDRRWDFRGDGLNGGKDGHSRRAEADLRK